MSYQILSQLSGPSIDTNLYASNASAGINAGNAQKTPTQAVIEGVTQGIRQGQAITQNQQQIEMNDQNIQLNEENIKQAPVRAQIQQEQLRGTQIRNDAAQTQATQEEKQIARENEFLQQYSQLNGNPKAQGDLIKSGTYNDVFAKDPQLMNQVVRQTEAAGGIDAETSKVLQGRAAATSLDQYYARESHKRAQELDESKRQLTTIGPYVDAAAQMGMSTDTAVDEMAFYPTSQYGKGADGKLVPSNGIVAPGSVEGYYVTDKRNGNVVGVIDKNAYTEVQKYRGLKSQADGTYAKADLQRKYAELGLDENGNPKKPDQAAGSQAPTKAPTGAARINSITPDVAITDNPGVLEATADIAHLSPTSVKENRAAVDSYATAIYDSVVAEQKKPQTFSSYMSGLFTGPSREQQALDAQRSEFAKVVARERLNSIIDTPAGRDLYSAQAVEDYNNEVRAYREGADITNTLERINHQRIAVSRAMENRYGLTLVDTPEDLYYLQNKDVIDNQVKLYEDTMRERFTQIYRRPIDIENKRTTSSAEDLKKSVGATIQPVRRPQQQQVVPTTKPAAYNTPTTNRGPESDADFRARINGALDEGGSIQKPIPTADPVGYDNSVSSNAATAVQDDPIRSGIEAALERGNQDTGVRMRGYPEVDTATLVDYKPSRAIESLKSVDLSQFDDIIADASDAYGVDENLIRAVILKESAGNPRAGSGAGAKGLMQLTKIAVEDLGLDPDNFDFYDPQANIQAGTKFLAKMIEANDGNLTLALAAFNAGIGNVKKYGGVPPFKETQDYVKAVPYLYTQI